MRLWTIFWLDPWCTIIVLGQWLSDWLWAFILPTISLKVSRIQVTPQHRDELSNALEKHGVLYSTALFSQFNDREYRHSHSRMWVPSDDSLCASLCCTPASRKCQSARKHASRNSPAPCHVRPQELFGLCSCFCCCCSLQLCVEFPGVCQKICAWCSTVSRKQKGKLWPIQRTTRPCASNKGCVVWHTSCKIEPPPPDGTTVTCEPLTNYWPWATCHTSLSKLRWDTGPRLKCWITALSTWGCVLASPWAWASNSNFLAMFWRRKLSKSISSGVIGCWTHPGLATMTVKESMKTTKGHMISPWGEECWVITSKIAEFWYYTSISCLIYIINYCKNIQNI